MSGLPTEQCTAHSKATGERCKKRVVGGGVCRKHGGGAPQVERKRLERVAMLELEAQASYCFRSDASPAEMLVAAAQSTDAVVRMIRHKLELGEVTPQLLDSFGAWLDRLTRTSAAVISSKADALVVEQLQRAATMEAETVLDLLAAVVDRLELSAEQRARIPDALAAALATMNDEQPALTT